MSLPTKITVRGTFVKTAGVAADDDVYETGKISIISDNWVKSPSLDFLVPPHKVEAELDSVGYFELSVISTNDPAWSPTNRTLVVKESLSGGHRTYRITVPYDTPGGVLDLADVSPVVTPTAPTQYVLLGTVQAKGDLIVGTSGSAVTRLPVGANSQVLVADSTSPSGLKWMAAGGGGAGIPQGTIDAKGDLVVGLADDTPGRQPVGTNGQYLKADSSTGTGLVWAAPTKTDVGLGSVDNTADADKPVSTPQQAALDGKAATVHTHAVADTTGLQAELDGKSPVGHGHTIADVDLLQAELDGKSPVGHTHAVADVTGLQTALDGKSATGHTHAIADTTGLQTALDGKSATGHTHAIADTTGLQTALDGKSATGHTHAIADTTGLQTALDGKSATGHTHAIADTTGLQTALDGKVDDAGAWTDPSNTGAGFTLDISGTFFTVKSRQETGDVIRLRGRVTRSTNYTADAEIITLPVGHRPAKTVIYAIRSGGTGAAQGFLSVAPTGVISWSNAITVSTGTAWFQFDGMTFNLND